MRAPITLATSLILTLGLATACTSTTWNSYPGGQVKYSEIAYDYTARPVLPTAQGKTYQLITDGGLSAITSVPALEKRGVRRAPAGADVVVAIKSGRIRHEPGSFGLRAPFKPALTASMPIMISVKDKGGQVIFERKLQHQTVLALNAGKGFKTRKEAKGAMKQISPMLKTKADAKVRQGAPRTVNKNLKMVVKDLFEPREVSVRLPAIRSAGGVDMEAAYTLLAKAEGDAQVKQALAAYAALGTEHKKADGTPDLLGNYGVLCGMAAAKVLSGDLSGAWQDTKKAWETMAMGKEHRLIARVLMQQQKQAGVEIIPKEDYDSMVKSDRQMALERFKQLMGK